jgi:hypothetical protein
MGESRGASGPRHARAKDKFADHHRLVEACRAPGCPVCRCLGELARRHLAAVLSEHVTDPASRARLAASGGFCATHAAVLPLLPDSALGSAILCEGLLGRARRGLSERRRALERPARDRAWTRLLRRRREPGGEGRRRPPGCPVCEMVARAERNYLDTLVASVEDAELAAAFRGSAGLCLPHLGLVLDRGDRRAAVLLDWTLDKVDRLLGDLRAFVDKHDYRATARASPEEAASWRAALALLAGAPDLFGPDLRPRGDPRRP